jgi:hypothetical protein
MNEHHDLRTTSPTQSPPPNYLVWAIVTTILCCLPFGIVSIVYAAQVNSKWQTGDYEGAKLASKNAKTWAWVAFAVGIAAGLIWSLMVMVGAVAGLGWGLFE